MRTHLNRGTAPTNCGLENWRSARRCLERRFGARTYATLLSVPDNKAMTHETALQLAGLNEWREVL